MHVNGERKRKRERKRERERRERERGGARRRREYSLKEKVIIYIPFRFMKSSKIVMQDVI